MPFLMINSQAHIKPQPQDIISWTNGTIITHGRYQIDLKDEGVPIDSESGSDISINRGRIAAYRKAREQAIEKMTLLVRKIRIDADTMLIDLLEENDVVQSRVANIITNRVKVSEFPIDF